MQGNPDIDILMIPTSKAIKKHVKDSDAITEIYNRAYEAVIISMEVKDAENAALREQNAKLENWHKRLVEEIDKLTDQKARLIETSKNLYVVLCQIIGRDNIGSKYAVINSYEALIEELENA